MKVQSQVTKDKLQTRLRRIEGQVRGVQRMLDDDRDCREIVQQLKAVRSATENATAVLMRAYAKECLLDVESDDRETAVDDLLTLLFKNNLA